MPAFRVVLLQNSGVVGSVPDGTLAAALFFMVIIMFMLNTEHSFDAAHFLKGYEGKCSNIHGHRWKVIARAASPDLNASGQTRGMIMDFGEFKAILRELVQTFDHTLIVEKGSLKETTMAALHEEGFSVTEVPFRPTAEELARYFFEALQERACPVCEVAVYETPVNCAIYSC